MTAHVAEGTAIIDAPWSVLHGRSFPSYTAYCLECVDELGVGWHGPAHMVSIESAPNAEALIDAELHDEKHHPDTPTPSAGGG